LKLLVKNIWKKIPKYFRVRLIRVWQDKFTVSAAAIIFDAGGRVLLLNHVLRPLSGWGLPGGFVEHGESPEDAIRREIREETGLDMEKLTMHRVRVIGGHVEILFTARAIGEAKVLSREILELGWFADGEMPEDMSAAQARIISSIDGRNV
jgi:ADP-ribose pyrophosphatase YjhB (NUDIX family)